MNFKFSEGTFFFCLFSPFSQFLIPMEFHNTENAAESINDVKMFLMILLTKTQQMPNKDSNEKKKNKQEKNVRTKIRNF